MGKLFYIVSTIYIILILLFIVSVCGVIHEVLAHPEVIGNWFGKLASGFNSNK